MSAAQSKAPTSRPQLFNSLKFWVSKTVTGYKRVQQRISDHGGSIAAYDMKADICLVDPNKPLGNSSCKCYHYRLVEHAISTGQLPDLEDYLVTLRSANDRLVGSGSAAGRKSTRTAFTPADDNILLQTVLPLVKKDGSYKGNSIYQQIAADYPHHPFQSWRSRFLDHVLPAHHKSLQTAAPSTTDTADQQQEVSNERPVKRRRVDTPPLIHDHGGYQSSIDHSNRIRTSRCRVADPKNLASHEDDDAQAEAISTDLSGHEIQGRHSTIDEDTDLSTGVDELRAQSGVVDLTHSDSRRQCLKFTPYVRHKSKTLGFSHLEADRLYKAVPDICGTPLAKIDESWAALAEDEAWKGHTADQWRSFYKHVILSEYMRRNNLTNEVELLRHAAEQRDSESYDQDGTPPIKRDPTPDLRSPEQKQAETERSRARLENEIVFSDISQESQTQHGAVSSLTPDIVLQPGQDQLSPHAQRLEIHANEGRKRSSQQTASTDEAADRSWSQPQSSVARKSLFGNVLNLSQTPSQNVLEAGLTTITNAAATQQPKTSSCDSNEKSNTDASASSLPAAQKPPESYQAPQSQSISQDMDEQNTDTKITGASAPVALGTQVSFDVDEEEAGPTLDLLGDGAADFSPCVSVRDESDTGSEYHYFDTTLEPSQAWDTAPMKHDVHDDSKASGDEREAEEEATTTPQPRHRMRGSTPIPKGSLLQHTTDEDDVTEASGQLMNNESSSANPRRRVETQALFVQRYQEEASEFDIPPPDGGWDVSAEETVDEQDPDLPISSVELPEHTPSTKYRRYLSATSETVSSTLEEQKDDSVHFNVVQRPSEVQAISSGEEDSEDETEDTVTDDDNDATAPNASGVRTASRELKLNSATVAGLSASAKAIQAMPARRRGSNLASALLANGAPHSTRGKDSITAWMQIQQSTHSKLPYPVFRRMVSVATQATSLNLPSAAWLLMSLVQRYEEEEAERRETHWREQKRLKKQGQPTSSFAARTDLTTKEAQAWLPEMAGTWTPDDDDYLFKGLPDGVKMMEKKHTTDEVQKRITWLRKRHLFPK